MSNRETTAERWGSTIGSAMFVTWLLFLGPVGLLAFLAVAYAMLVENLALGIVGGLLFAAPIILTAPWIPVAFYALLRERSASAVPAAGTASEAVRAD